MGVAKVFVEMSVKGEGGVHQYWKYGCKRA